MNFILQKWIYIKKINLTYILIFNILIKQKQNRGHTLRKKGITIWLLSTLTIITILHLIDSINALFFNNQTQLLQLYPIANTILTQLSTQTYFYLSAGTAAILWGITCIIAFDNPIETFLNQIFSDAQKQRIEETQTIEKNSDFFELMYETLENNGETLAEIKDLIRNVRTEVREIAPLKESIEKTRNTITKINTQLNNLEEHVLFPLLCPSCRKPIRADFKHCPYCNKMLQIPEITSPIIEK